MGRMSKGMQNAALAALAVITVILVVWAFAHVRADPPTSDAPAGMAPGSTGGTDVVGTSDGGAGDSETGDDGTGSDGDEGSADVAESGAGDLGAAQQVLAGSEPVTMAVLGDSTSNTRTEWVHRWATDLAQDRPVTISHWDESSQDGYVEPDVLSEQGEGSAVTIWSGSQTGAEASYPATVLDQIVPEEPDLAIYNFGHNSTADEVAGEFSTLHQAMTDRFGAVPTVVILQQPQVDDANAEAREVVEAWANEAGLATIDVAEAFQETGEPETLLGDTVHPNEAGSELWAETVDEALTQ